MDTQDGQQKQRAEPNWEVFFNSLTPKLASLEDVEERMSPPSLISIATLRAETIRLLAREMEDARKNVGGNKPRYEDIADLYQHTVHMFFELNHLEENGEREERSDVRWPLAHLERDKLIALFEVRADALLYITEAVQNVLFSVPMGRLRNKTVVDANRYVKMIVRKLGEVEDGIINGKVDLKNKSYTLPTRH